MKKIISLAASLAIAVSSLCFGSMISVGAVDNDTTLLSDLGIMTDGRLDDYVTRCEFAKVVVASSKYRNYVSSGLKTSPYSDVPYYHWASQYIKAAVSHGICEGYADGSFRPDNNVTLAEAVTMTLRALDYTDEDFDSSWPYGQMGAAANLGITDGITCGAFDAITRSDVAIIINHALLTKCKDSQQTLLENFDCKSTDNAVIIATHNEDPSVNSNKVVTTEGTYDLGAGIDASIAGRKGTIAVKDGDTLVSFKPNDQTVEEHTVTSVIGEDLLLDGAALEFGSSSTVYFKSQTYTYPQVVSLARKGDTMKVFRNSLGEIEYGLLIRPVSAISNANTGMMDKYFVYSVLDSGIVTYRNGSFGSLDISSGTTAYINSQPSTYAQVKEQLEMGDIVYVKYDDNGNVDYVSVEEGNVIGPIIVSGGEWSNSVADFSGYSITKDGASISTADIKTYDVVYCVPDLKLALVYSKKVTGTYESASPNMASPNKVTISGTEYEVESTSAFNALSSGGSFRYGDTVTVLIGKNGGIAGVVSPNSANSTVTGFLVGAGQKTYTDAISGGVYSSFYINIVTADGTEHEYKTSKSYADHINSVGTVTINNGVASFAQRSYNSLSGTVAAASRRIGTTKVASNVAILDVVPDDAYSNTLYTNTFLQRINGVQLSSSNVLYYEKNSSDEITSLILKNVTGDAYSYGVVTSASTSSNMMSSSGAYTIDVGGMQYNLSGNGVYNSIQTGSAVQVNLKGNSVSTMSRLSATSTVSSITDDKVLTGKESYTLDPSATVYKNSNYSYTRITLDELKKNFSNYYVTAYYDNSSAKRVRVIIVTVK